MTKGLSEKQVKWVTWLVIILIGLMSFVVVWNTDRTFQIKEQLGIIKETLPKEYVRLERYISDERKSEIELGRIYGELKSINEKLDKFKR